MTNNILRMIRYASKAHEGQVRKHNGRPYFNDHCLRLMGHLANDSKYGKDEEAALIILAHDVVEDCSVSDADTHRKVRYDEIENKFGLVIAEGVGDLTDEYTKERYLAWNRAKRKDAELKRLCGIRDRSKTLKLYDRWVNLTDLIADRDFNVTYARESWDMAYHLSDPDNLYIAVKVLVLAAEVQDKAGK